MKKIYVIDTNVIFDDPRVVEKLSADSIIIPFQVLEEIDNHKCDKNHIGANARYFSRFLNTLFKDTVGSPIVRTDRYTLSIIPWSKDMSKKLDDLSLEDMPDNRIIITALGIKNSVLVTGDISMRLKAGSLGQKCKPYQAGETANSIEEVYSGIREMTVSDTLVDSLYAQGSIDFESDMYDNEYAILRSEIDGKKSALVRHDDGELIRIQDRKSVSGIKPKNVKQTVALDAMFDDDITLVTLLGPAGVGKTLISLAAAIEQTLGSANKYDKIILMKAPVPVGLDIGYLPGTLLDKIIPHFQSYIDNLELLMPNSTKSPMVYLNHLMDIGKLELLPPTYIRGRSLPKTFIICDEAQNLTRDEIKAIATRIGEDSKLIVMGDIYQIDRTGLDFANNGLTHIIESFKEHECAAHITLTKGERSSFAEIAAELL